ncbi:MAG: amidohydrolase [Steroidobacteraceae bacterium]
MRTLPVLIAAGLAGVASAAALAGPSDADIAALVTKENPRVVAWRRDFHQHPELSNREVRTAGIVAAHLRRLGLEVRTGVAKTGVVAVLQGGRPGPTVALRADMDALPVTEKTDVPFRSTATASYQGETVGVMHACGHDAHTAILMGVAEILAGLRADLPGKVLFIFQPAEEGPPDGEEGGAPLMLKEGVFADPKPDALFGLHVFSTLPAGTIGYRPGAFMAGSDGLRIVVNGRQTHGARPWAGLDPIVVSAQIISALQAVVSRQVDLTLNPAIVTIGMIRGGTRGNIIPDSVEMRGTIRTYDPAQRTDVLARVTRTATRIAEASGATAQVQFGATPNPVTRNDPALTQRAVPTLTRVAGEDRIREIGLQTPSEDFSYFAREVPSLFFFVGVAKPGVPAAEVADNHSPLFYVDEAALPVGVRALTQLAVDYLTGRMQ